MHLALYEGTNASKATVQIFRHPALLPYDVTKAEIANMVGTLSQMLAEKGR